MYTSLIEKMVRSTLVKPVPGEILNNSIVYCAITKNSSSKVSAVILNGHQLRKEYDLTVGSGKAIDEKQKRTVFMPCLTNRQKLILLCCSALVVSLVTCIMVINAFFQKNSVNTTLQDVQDTEEGDTITSTNSIMGMVIKVQQFTTSVKTVTGKTSHHWLDTQTAASSTNKPDSFNDDSEEGESSGSGQGDPKSYVDKKTSEMSKQILVTDLTTRTSEKLTNTLLYSGNPSKENGGSQSLEKKSGYTRLIDNFVPTPTTTPSVDSCERWLRCEDPFLNDYIKKFSQLPSCPCTYTLSSSNLLWDEYHQKFFKWKDSHYSEAYLAAYHRGAKLCIRSHVESNTLAAQNCCYDKHMNLITRGSGAGTPAVISPDISEPLHMLIDHIPWVICRGDWTKYNAARPPNNFRKCKENPHQQEFIYQIWLTKNA